MNIAILMTCHNRRETTLRCLDELAAAAREVNRTTGEGSGSEFHVFLVDDGSTDGTSEAIKEYFARHSTPTPNTYTFPLRLHLISGSGTLYWAKGMSLAWRKAIACETARDGARALPCENAFTHFLWLNDDVQLKPNAITQAIEDWHQCGDGRGVIVGACSTDRTETKSSYSATTSQDVQIFPNGRAPQRADGWFNGNFVLVPKAAYDQVGIISDEYSHARADYDYAERLKRIGIPFFCSSQFVGVCEKDWAKKIKGRGLAGRIRTLWTPGYSNLEDLFRFKFRYYGLVRALLSVGHMIWIVIKG